MKHVPSVRPFVLKELREIGPLWLIGVGLITITAIGLPGMPPAVFVGCSLALGAMALGHEFRRGTISMVLVQPVSRARVLAIKIGVLSVLLGTLAALMRLVDADLRFEPRAFVVTLAASLCLAPGLTLIARSELAGLTFAAALPVVLWMGAQLAAVARYGLSPLQSDDLFAFRNLLFDAALTFAAVAVCVLGVMLFLRLEATESGRFGGRRISSPRTWRARADVGLTRRSVYQALVRKELHLYGLPAAIAGLFAAGWILTALLESTALADVDVEVLGRGFSHVYLAVIALLVGAVASAEERQIGTLACESLLPLAAWKRWVIKITCAGGVLIVLGVLLPWGLSAMLPTPDPSGVREVALRHEPWPVSLLRLEVEGVAALASGFAAALYVSSLSTGALRAFLGSFAVIVAVGWILLGMLSLIVHPLARSFTAWLALETDSWLTNFVLDGRGFHKFRYWEWLPIVWAAVLLPMALRYAGANHASFERPVRILRRQLPRLFVAILLMASLQVVLSGVMDAAFRARWRDSAVNRAEVGYRAPSIR